MDNIEFNGLSASGATIMLFFAGLVGVIFVIFILREYFVKKERRPKGPLGADGKPSLSEERTPGFFRRLRHMQRSLQQDMARRRRHAERARDRERQ